MFHWFPRTHFNSVHGSFSRGGGLLWLREHILLRYHNHRRITLNGFVVWISSNGMIPPNDMPFSCCGCLVNIPVDERQMPTSYDDDDDDDDSDLLSCPPSSRHHRQPPEGGYLVETWTREWLLIDCLYRVLADSGDYIIENPCWAVSISKHCVDGNLYKKRQRENKWACDRLRTSPGEKERERVGNVNPSRDRSNECRQEDHFGMYVVDLHLRVVSMSTSTSNRWSYLQMICNNYQKARFVGMHGMTGEPVGTAINTTCRSGGWWLSCGG